MLPWVGRSLIILLTFGLAILLKSNVKSGFIAFVLAVAISIVLSEINDGLITLIILTVLIGNIIANWALGEKFILPWSEVAIMIATAVLIEILLSTSQATAFLDFFTLISTTLIIILCPYLVIPPTTPVANAIQSNPVRVATTIIKPIIKPIATSKLQVKPIIKPKSIVKSQPIVKSVIKPQPIATSATNNLNNPSIVKVNHHVVASEHGTAQRLLSIAAMVIVYLIIL